MAAVEVAILLAHKVGIRLHAWVNVVPAWWGTTPPADPTHLYHTRPEWFWYDQHGERQALSPRFYGLPTNRSQKVTVETDCAQAFRYAREDEVDVAVLVPS